MADAGVFAARVGALLEGDPVTQTVLCSLLASAVRGAGFEEARWFAVVDGGEVVGAAGRTSAPYPLVVTPMVDEALAVLVDAVRAELGTLKAAAGPRPVVDEYVARWRAASREVPREKMAMRLFRLDEVTPPVGVPGELRLAGELPEFGELFVEWTREFVRIIEGEEARDAAGVVARLTARDGLWVWCDGGKPVSYASTTVPAYGVVRIGLVYTPEELRGRGYAGASVAAISQRVLDRGELPVLFTDLANPTSNRVYQRIGYRAVSDAAEYAFASPADT